MKYCKENKTKFALQCHDNDPEYVDLSAKIYDPKTIIEEKEIFEKEKKIGVSIDVFVIDGLGDTEASAIRAFRAKAVQRELIVASQWKNFFRSKTHAWYYEPIRLALFVASRFINKKSMLENLENIGWTKQGHESLYNIYIMEEVQTILAMGAGGSTKLVDKEGGRLERVFNYKFPLEYNKHFELMLKRKNEIEEFYAKEK